MLMRRKKRHPSFDDERDNFPCQHPGKSHVPHGPVHPLLASTLSPPSAAVQPTHSPTPAADAPRKRVDSTSSRSSLSSSSGDVSLGGSTLSSGSLSTGASHHRKMSVETLYSQEHSPSTSKATCAHQRLVPHRPYTSPLNCGVRTNLPDGRYVLCDVVYSCCHRNMKRCPVFFMSS